MSVENPIILSLFLPHIPETDIDIFSSKKSVLKKEEKYPDTLTTTTDNLIAIGRLNLYKLGFKEKNQRFNIIGENEGPISKARSTTNYT